MLSPGSRLLQRAALAACVGGALASTAAPSAAHAAASFAGGNIAYQSGSQCGLGGTIGYGANTGSWVSWYTDPNAGYPAVGDKYWLRIDAMAIGYTCAGFVSDIATELALPANTRLAIDLQSQDPSDRVRCFYEGPSGTVEVTDRTWRIPDIQASGSWCNSRQAPSPSANGYHLGQRMIGPGESFFLVVPVMSTKRLAGMGGAGNTTKAIATLQSGINTTAQPYQWVTVFDRAAAIGFDANPISAVGDTTATTTGLLGAWYRKGTLYHDLGLAGSGQFPTTTNPIAIDGQHAGYTSKQTWASLTPGTTYQWRMRFVDAETGAVTTGETKTFKTTGTAPVTPPPAPPTPPAGGGGVTPGGGGTGGGGTGGGGTGGGGVTPPVTDGGGGGGDQKPPADGSGQQPPADQGGTGGGGSTPPAGGASPGPSPAGARASTSPPNAVTTRAPSTFPPAARLVQGGRLGALAKPAGLGVDVSCATACSAKVTLKVDAATARKLGLGRKAVVVASGSGTSARGGTVRVALRASGAAKRKLGRAKKVKATLTVAVDGSAPINTTVTLAR